MSRRSWYRDLLTATPTTSDHAECRALLADLARREDDLQQRLPDGPDRDEDRYPRA